MRCGVSKVVEHASIKRENTSPKLSTHRSKDKIYDLLSDLNRDSIAKFLFDNDYETDAIDFKEIWIEKGKLAKIILAMANNGGGIIVIGIKENSDGTTEPCGLDEFKDEAKVRNSVKKYIPETLSFKVEDYSFDASEYEKLRNKKFQLVIIEDTPEHFPFISMSEGDDIKASTIYIRHGTKSDVANNSDIQKIIDRRIKTGYISEIDLQTQLTQLRILYRNNDNMTPTGIVAPIAMLFAPKAPEEFNVYIDELIEKKKNLIEKDLGIF